MNLKMKGLIYFLLYCIVQTGSAFASDTSSTSSSNNTAQHHKHKHKYGYSRYKGTVGYKELAAPIKSPNHFEVIGAPGIAKLNASNGELGVTSSETDKLVQTNSSSWNTIAGQLGAGYVYYFRDAQQYSTKVQWFPSMEPELNLYYLSSNSIDGNVWRFNNPNFNQLTFDMPLRSTRLMLDLALTIASYKQGSLYVIGGIGEAWNRLGYSDRFKSNVPCPDQTIHLNNHTQSNFVWEVGPGVSFSFNDRVSLTFEYLYTHLGTVHTSGSGRVGLITAPMLSPAHFNLASQTALLGLHIAL